MLFAQPLELLLDQPVRAQAGSPKRLFPLLVEPPTKPEAKVATVDPSGRRDESPGRYLAQHVMRLLPRSDLDHPIEPEYATQRNEQPLPIRNDTEGRACF